MQKVLSITLTTSVLRNHSFAETDFPELQKFLAEGYAIRNIIPMPPVQGASYCILTFVLDNDYAGDVHVSGH